MGVRPGTPKPPGSGRKRGSVNKAKRAELTDKLAHQIWQTFVRLGPDWLYDLAQKKPELFVAHFLSRFAPPPQKGDEDGPLVALNFNGDITEAGRRVAFLLASSLDAQGADPVAAREPYSRIAPENPAGPSVYPADPAPDPAREEWARQAAMTPMERLDSMSLDEHTNMRAFADPGPAPRVQQKVRTPVRLRNRRDLL